jgi:hypothetical protein
MELESLVRGSLPNYDIPYEDEWGVDVSTFLGPRNTSGGLGRWLNDCF